MEWFAYAVLALFGLLMISGFVAYLVLPLVEVFVRIGRSISSASRQ